MIENDYSRLIMNEGRRGIRILRYTLFGLCLTFAVFSLFFFSVKAKVDGIMLSLATIILVCLPNLTEKLFKRRMYTPFYVLAILYTICPLLGHSYKFYYIIPFWDKILHTTGGVVFAIVGSYIPVILNRHEKSNNSSILMRALFALCFSIALSAVWEFFEFAADMWFGQDMQNDTYIYTINSYNLGAKLGEIGSITNIESVVVNGVPLEGYLDIGLIDTMCDMLVESFGALVYSVWLMIDRDRHPILMPKDYTFSKSE